MNIYAGNLSWNLKDQDLQNLFAEHGEVSSAKIVTDKFTGRSKGFGFVEMPNDDQAQAAIAALNGTEHDGRNIVVNESRPSLKAGAAVASRKEASAAVAVATKVVAAATKKAVVDTVTVETVADLIAIIN